MLVTFARSVGTRDAELGRVCQDGMAQRMLPDGLRRVVNAPGAWQPAALRRLSVGLFDHVSLRTDFIDAALAEGVVAGARQVVILGAGFDTRAYRLTCLVDCQVFEVDHPDTQAAKRIRSQGLQPLSAALQRVACDFHDGELTRVLGQAGFDAQRPSVWIWEGVTMYLREQAVRDTLDAIAQLSAAGSMLISSYVRPELASGGPLWGRVGSAVLSAVAEPVHFVCSPATYERLLGEHGFAVTRDVTAEERAAERGVRLLRLRACMPQESFNVARRDAPSRSE